MSVNLVAIGASLGGFDAVRLLLGDLPSDFPVPVVVVQHRMSDPDGRLVELLSERSALPVSEPDDKEPIVPGHVYLAPSDYHLLVAPGVFELSTDEPVRHARPSIDVLFESAADAYGAALLAVVLTGSNRDGANGARVVKNAGGRVLVQDPTTALSPESPRAVLGQTPVDGVLPIERMAARMIELCEGRTST